MKALIFDCDGVLVDTERDGHRVAFNRAFAASGLDAHWDVDLYGELLKVAGGKERMKHYFDSAGWPVGSEDNEQLIKELHKIKTDAFRAIVESGELDFRPGVVRLIDEAIAKGVKLAVCSTSNERAVQSILDKLGPARKSRFDAILAGDIVSRKKPDPEIYLRALEELEVDPADCFVVEDNRNGLLAAKAAGISCVVTTSSYSQSEDFHEADLVVDELGDPPSVRVTLEQLEAILRKQKRERQE